MIDKLLSDTKLKQSFDKCILKLIGNKISANQLTIAGLILGFLSAVSIFLSSIFINYFFIFLVLGITFMVLSFFIDLFDGIIARFDNPTIFGGILDMTCDRTVEVSIIIAIILTDPSNLVIPGIFVLGSIVLCITVFLSVGHALNEEEIENQKFIFYSTGLMERSETFLILLITIILINFRFILLTLFSILTSITTIQRIGFAYKKFHKKK
ncbi:MAG: conserved membrane protein of unknown function [Promethearchaeota archaeon]|nr:MAG: conserved membrane protein of unknown function [Candidatus Lokiarchaeota archaeon]